MKVKEVVEKMCFETFEIFDCNLRTYVCMSDVKRTWKEFENEEVIMMTTSRVNHRIVIGID